MVETKTEDVMVIAYGDIKKVKKRKMGVNVNIYFLQKNLL